MAYLITQILLCLIIAFLLGLLIGYIFGKCRSNCKDRGADKERGEKDSINTTATYVSPYTDDDDDTAMINLDTDVDLDSDVYGIETLEGIGPQTGSLLRDYGVKTVGDLLRKLHAPAARKQAAKELNILEKPLHDWASMSDLLRVKGVDHQYAELIYTSGIVTVGQLANSNAEELLEEMETVNSAGKQTIAPTVPTIEDVKGWIETAKNMSPVVTI